MSQHVDTRTIHTITIDVQDDVIGKVEEGDEVEFVLTTRYGPLSRKKATWRDIQTIVGNGPDFKRF
jgi:hypothetical protein